MASSRVRTSCTNRPAQAIDEEQWRRAVERLRARRRAEGGEGRPGACTGRPTPRTAPTSAPTRSTRWRRCRKAYPQSRSLEEARALEMDIRNSERPGGDPGRDPGRGPQALRPAGAQPAGSGASRPAAGADHPRREQLAQAARAGAVRARADVGPARPEAARRHGQGRRPSRGAVEGDSVSGRPRRQREPGAARGGVPEQHQREREEARVAGVDGGRGARPRFWRPRPARRTPSCAWPPSSSSA